MQQQLKLDEIESLNPFGLVDDLLLGHILLPCQKIDSFGLLLAAKTFTKREYLLSGPKLA
jgi:hypothetical protein